MRISFILLCAMMIAACGPLPEQPRAAQSKKANTERSELAREARVATTARLRQQFDAVEFPGPKLSDGAFTFDVQDFFAQTNGKPIVFSAYTEDVEAAKGGVIVEFSVPVAATILDNGTLVRFRLAATVEQVRALLARHPVRSLVEKPMRPTDAIVVARIERAERVRRYQIAGEQPEPSEPVDRSVDTSLEVLATGTLLAVELSDAGPLMPKVPLRQ